MDNQNEELFGQTPWQTVGPFFHYCLAWKGAGDLTGQSELGARPELLVAGHDHLPHHNPGGEIRGDHIEIRGRVLDGNGDGVPDALLEIWQADGNGMYDSTFCLFGRCATNAAGGFAFQTIRPGAVTDRDGQRHAPHVTVGIFARGVIKRLITRMYFGDAVENAGDPTLSLVPAHRRTTLMAHPADGAWTFDIVLQGNNETVFFQC